MWKHTHYGEPSCSDCVVTSSLILKKVKLTKVFAQDSQILAVMAYWPL